MRKAEGERRREEGEGRSLLAFVLLFLLSISSIQAQTNPQGAVALASELTRLEIIASGSAPQEQYSALMRLARLNQLMGDTEAQLGILDRVLTLFPGDGRALAEQGRLLISIGEHEKAAAVAAQLLSINALTLEKEHLLEGLYLLAQIEAFRSGNILLLVGLLDEPDFSSYKSGIYYTLWKLTGESLYRNRLSAEFPQSPEAKIAANTVSSSATPLWLLFPGRESIGLAAPVTVAQPESIVAPAAISPAANSRVVTSSASGPAQTVVLQTGLFGREENARAMAESLRRAGFEPETYRRHVNNNVFWAVTVLPGNNMNATIQRLKTAGFESFPVNM